MILTPLKPLTFNTTNLTEDTTPAWVASSSYAIDTIRQKDTKLWKSLDKIDPLCEYVYDNTDPLKPHYTIVAETGAVVGDTTAVHCTLNQTVVYVKDQNKYFLFNNATGTTLVSGDVYAVDFETQDPNTPPNFTEVTGYRYLVYEPSETPLKWEDLGYTNKYKCLDSSLSSQTVFNGNIEMSFLTSKVNEVHLFNIIANTVRIVVTDTDSSNVIYDNLTLLSDKDGGTFFNYFFNDFYFRNKISESIPIATNVQIDITLTPIGSETRVGLVAIGKSKTLGGTLYGADLSILDFSKKVTDRITGETRLEQGNFKATNSLTVDVVSNLTDSVYNTLAEYRGTPVVFSNDTFDSLKIFGIYKKFNILISTPTVSKMSVDVESLI